jgi:Lon protease-like protein
LARAQVAATLQLGEILRAYLDRNVTTRYSNDYPVWQVGARTWHGMAWHGMAWHGMAWQQHSCTTRNAPAACGAAPALASSARAVLLAQECRLPSCHAGRQQQQ